MFEQGSIASGGVAFPWWDVLFGEAIEFYGPDCTPVRLERRRKIMVAGFLNVHGACAWAAWFA